MAWAGSWDASRSRAPRASPLGPTRFGGILRLSSRNRDRDRAPRRPRRPRQAGKKQRREETGDSGWLGETSRPVASGAGGVAGCPGVAKGGGKAGAKGGGSHRSEERHRLTLHASRLTLPPSPCRRLACKALPCPILLTSTCTPDTPAATELAPPSPPPPLPACVRIAGCRARTLG